MRSKFTIRSGTPCILILLKLFEAAAVAIGYGFNYFLGVETLLHFQLNTK
jgi:hypothetical protein